MYSRLIFILTLVGVVFVGTLGYQVLSDMNEAITHAIGVIK